MKAAGIVLVVALASSASCFADGFVVHGQEKSCFSISELDRALSVEDRRYFWGWDESDYDAAASWATACMNSGGQFAGATRVSRLRAMQKKLQHLQEREAYAAAAPQRRAEEAERKEAARKEREQKQQEQAARKQAVDDKSAQLEECKKTPTYSMYLIQDMVIADLDNIKGAKEQQAMQRRYAAASKVRDLYEERAAGEALVQAQDSLKTDFAEYKRLGGRASSPSAIKGAPNPCETVEAELQALRSPRR